MSANLSEVTVAHSKIFWATSITLNFVHAPVLLRTRDTSAEMTTRRNLVVEKTLLEQDNTNPREQKSIITPAVPL